MRMIKWLGFWKLVLIAGAVLLASCGGRVTPSSTTSAPPGSPTVATSGQIVAAVGRDGGGITSGEPTLAPARENQPAAATPTRISPSPAPATPIPPTPTLTASPSPLPPTWTPASATSTATGPAPAIEATVGTAAARPVSTTIAAPAVPFTPSTDPDPLQIEVMRRQSYPGSEIKFEQTLAPGANYSQYVVSYRSDGLKIYALMTIPTGPKPATGWPAIIFNHGYIAPSVYRTTERYVGYVDTLARNGYIVFKSDYRGHGGSEGRAEGGYGTPGYTNDVLNAMMAVEAYKDTDPNRIGMWGHSMGGQIVLRSMVVAKEIKAGVIWAGVVAPYPDLFARTNDPRQPTATPGPSPTPRATATPIPPGGLGPFGRPWRQEFIAKYGTPEQNPAFWASISPNSFLKDLSGPIQLHHSTTDEDVPAAASETLHAGMKAAGKPVEMYIYPGDNHNINANFAIAMQRTVAFFDKYVKGS